MNEQQITEAYFLARGWTQRYHKISKNSQHWFTPNGVGYGLHLPNILDHYPTFKREVLEVMEGEGRELEIIKKHARWTNEYGMAGYWQEPIKDNNILHAAVIAATRYFEEKKK